MKSILYVILISVFSTAFSQSSKKIKYEELISIPGGEVSLKMSMSDTLKKKFNIKPFYIKEISNAEYREFINDIRKNPDKKLIWSKRIYLLENGIRKDSNLIFTYKDVAENLIDTTRFPFPNYLENPKYDRFLYWAYLMRLPDILLHGCRKYTYNI
ncbi:MAG: hypothetical protein H7Y07_17140 [Pyrinomonadaceae bacterium]|nr:hypothetical protein [Sphingobacteriaceae bacterium]